MSIEETIEQVVEDVSLKAIERLQDENTKNLISGTADKISDNLIRELKKQKLIRTDPKGIYKKTEVLLYAYIHFQDLIRDKQEELCELQSYGLRKKSSGITFFSSSSSPDTRSEYEKIEERLEAVQKELDQVDDWIRKLEDGLQILKLDPFFYVIQEHYFHGETYEKISADHKITVETVKKQKNRMIAKLETKLFLWDYVQQSIDQIGLI